MREYRTKSGDTWDLIAYEQLGSSKYVEKLINANREYTFTVIFSAGVILQIPDIDSSVSTSKLPPWRVKND